MVSLLPDDGFNGEQLLGEDAEDADVGIEVEHELEGKIAVSSVSATLRRPLKSI